MIKRGITILVAASAITVTCAYASPEGDLKYMGYSQEMVSEVLSATGCEPAKPETAADSEQDEADSNLEQLTELGVTRSLTPTLENRSGAIRDEVLTYWDKMSPAANNVQPISAETRAMIETNIRTALESAGYSIVQLSLVDLPEGSLKNMLRAIVRATRPLKTRNSYKEIQGNLAEIKKLCMEAGTIDGIVYLSEMTTFVAENPRNNYYYEKTILNP